MNILGGAFSQETRVLDLYAGAGALGIEALSRGAGHATFVDQADAACRCIRENLAGLGVSEQATVLNRFLDNPRDEAAIATLSAEPAFLVEVSTTCVTTMLEAGHAENALTQRARATVNCRIFPGESVETVQARLAGAIANPEATITVDGNPTVSPISEPRPDVTAAITRSIHRRHPGRMIARAGVRRCPGENIALLNGYSHLVPLWRCVGR